MAPIIMKPEETVARKMMAEEGKKRFYRYIHEFGQKGVDYADPDMPEEEKRARVFLKSTPVSELIFYSEYEFKARAFEEEGLSDREIFFAIKDMDRTWGGKLEPELPEADVDTSSPEFLDFIGEMWRQYYADPNNEPLHVSGRGDLLGRRIHLQRQWALQFAEQNKK